MSHNAIEAAQAAIIRQEAAAAEYDQVLVARGEASGVRRLYLGVKSVLLGVAAGESAIAAEVAEYDAAHPHARSEINVPTMRTQGDV